MRESKLKSALEKQTIGYWSVFPGIEVKEILDDKLELVHGTMTATPRRKLLKIHYTPTTNRAFVIIDMSYRLYLEDCIRV